MPWAARTLRFLSLEAKRRTEAESVDVEAGFRGHIVVFILVANVVVASPIEAQRLIYLVLYLCSADVFSPSSSSMKRAC